MNALLDLAAKCEAASTPDRSLDFAIYAALNPDLDLESVKPKHRYLYGENYTASLDAALALVPQGSHIFINGYKAENFWNRARVQTFKQEGETPDEAKATTLPLALCAAALRARVASGMEAATAGETSTEIEGSTEGDSPTGKAGDAQ